MIDLLSASRAAFLTEVRRVRPASLREVEVGEIVDALITWSVAPERGLRVRPRGKQQTVSFLVEDSGDVLWAVYPVRTEGAKVVVLPQRFRRLAGESRRALIAALGDAVPDLQVNPTGYLQVPLHRLTSDNALAAFLGLLGTARSFSLGIPGRVPIVP